MEKKMKDKILSFSDIVKMKVKQLKKAQEKQDNQNNN